MSVSLLRLGCLKVFASDREAFDRVLSLFWYAPRSARCLLTIFSAVSITLIAMFALSGFERLMT